jgi:hypothetical protein
LGVAKKVTRLPERNPACLRTPTKQREIQN